MYQKNTKEDKRKRGKRERNNNKGMRKRRKCCVSLPLRKGDQFLILRGEVLKKGG